MCVTTQSFLLASGPGCQPQHLSLSHPFPTSHAWRNLAFFSLPQTCGFLLLPGAGTAAPPYRQARVSLRACLLLWLGDAAARRARYARPTFLPSCLDRKKNAFRGCSFQNGKHYSSQVASNASVLHLLFSSRPPAVFGHRLLLSPRP